LKKVTYDLPENKKINQHVVIENINNINYDLKKFEISSVSDDVVKIQFEYKTISFPKTITLKNSRETILLSLANPDIKDIIYGRSSGSYGGTATYYINSYNDTVVEDLHEYIVKIFFDNTDFDHEKFIIDMLSDKANKECLCSVKDQKSETYANVVCGIYHEKTKIIIMEKAYGLPLKKINNLTPHELNILITVLVKTNICLAQYDLFYSDFNLNNIIVDRLNNTIKRVTFIDFGSILSFKYCQEIDRFYISTYPIITQMDVYDSSTITKDSNNITNMWSCIFQSGLLDTISEKTLQDLKHMKDKTFFDKLEYDAYITYRQYKYNISIINMFVNILYIFVKYHTFEKSTLSKTILMQNYAKTIYEKNAHIFQFVPFTNFYDTNDIINYCILRNRIIYSIFELYTKIETISQDNKIIKRSVVANNINIPIINILLNLWNNGEIFTTPYQSNIYIRVLNNSL
jgi:hypothetical protein